MRTLSFEEVMRRLNRTRRTIYYMLKDGRLKAERAGASQRITIDSLEKLMKERT
jgi:excisionase family DNA binding protein